jgi:hypothetical protein
MQPPISRNLITRADLPAFKELILSYQQWRKANGMPESLWWNERLRSALEDLDIVKPRAAADRRIIDRTPERRDPTSDPLAGDTP